MSSPEQEIKSLSRGTPAFIGEVAVWFIGDIIPGHLKNGYPRDLL